MREIQIAELEYELSEVALTIAQRKRIDEIISNLKTAAETRSKINKPTTD